MTEFTGQCMDPGKDPVPETPELWWSPILGVLIRSGAGGYWHLLDNEAWPLPAPEYHQDETLPADAVKLGSVEALREPLERATLSRDNHMNRAITAEDRALKLERMLDEARAVLNGQRLIGMGDQDYAIARIRNILGDGS